MLEWILISNVKLPYSLFIKHHEWLYFMVYIWLKIKISILGIINTFCTDVNIFVLRNNFIERTE